jgi:hypothetical protein
MCSVWFCVLLPVQVFPTQRVVLRIRCSKATVQLVGYALSSAPAQIKVRHMQLAACVTLKLFDKLTSAWLRGSQSCTITCLYCADTTCSKHML